MAITRAKRGLVVVGNADTLRRDALWKSYIKHLKQRGLYIFAAGEEDAGEGSDVIAR